MKKGFTLIELLAVIVILAIIALIATPIVLNIINDTKESSVLRSAEFYMDAVELSIAQATLKNQSIQDGTYTIMGNGNICLGSYNGTTCTGDEMKVEVNGESPNGGVVIIEGGEIVEVALNISSKPVVYYSYLGETKILEGEEWVIPEENCFEDNFGDNSYPETYITDYTCDYKNIIIPSVIYGKAVTSIEIAFNNKGLTGIILPDTITKLDQGPFIGNNFEEIVIPKSSFDIEWAAGPGLFHDNPKLKTIVNKTAKPAFWAAYLIPSNLISSDIMDLLIIDDYNFVYGRVILPSGQVIDIIGPNGETGETYDLTGLV